MTSVRLAVWGGLLLLVMAGCASEDDHDHHDHEEEHAEHITATVWTDQAEWFVEHDPLVAGAHGHWDVHLTDLDTFRPIDHGELTLSFVRGEDEHAFTASAPASAGVFELEPELPEAGSYEVALTWRGNDTHTAEIGTRTVHATAEEAHHGEHDDHTHDEHDGHDHDSHEHDEHTHDDHDDHAHEEHDHDHAHDDDDHDHAHDDHDHDEDTIALDKEQQWAVDFATNPVGPRDVANTVAASGEIVPEAGQMVRITAPMSGLILGEPNLDAPAPGTRVEAGDVLAVVSPTDDGSYAEAKARVERLEREVERAERLYDEDAIPEQRLIDRRHELEVATAALESMGGSADDEGYDHVIRSPIDGWVHERSLTPGVRVDAGDSLFTVVNTDRVWLRAMVPAAAAARVGDAGTASFTVEGSNERFTTDTMISSGAVIDADTRTLPVHFEIENSDRQLKIGMLADARLEVEGHTSGLAIPNTAIREEEGVPVAYVQTGGETFERRLLQTGPTDGTYTIVERGLDPGERVVTEGAYQVYLASIDTDDAGGHHHHH